MRITKEYIDSLLNRDNSILYTYSEEQGNDGIIAVTEGMHEAMNEIDLDAVIQKVNHVSTLDTNVILSDTEEYFKLNGYL